MNPYKSCNCFQCRHTPSKIRGGHKREAHRKMRRETKKALRNDEEVPNYVSTGYRA